jgi:hypothetical protein
MAGLGEKGTMAVVAAGGNAGSIRRSISDPCAGGLNANRSPPAIHRARIHVAADPLPLLSEGGLGLKNALAERNDEIRSFAGFAGGDALIGNDDRAAGRKRLDNSRHRIRGDAEAI